MSEGILAADLDGTLVSGNTFPRFVVFLALWLLRRLHLVDAAELMSLTVGRKLGLVSHERLKLTTCVLAGRLDDASLAEFGTQQLARWSQQEPASVVAAWPGRRIMVTAAPASYARKLGLLLGFDDVVGSEVVDGRLQNNEGATKVVALRQLGIHQLAMFLTDDLVLDGPLAHVAAEVWLVDRTGMLRKVKPAPELGGVPPSSPNGTLSSDPQGAAE